MKVKLLEVRDSGTFISVFAFEASLPAAENEEQRYLLGRAGFYERRLIMLGQLGGGHGRAACDPYACDPYDWAGVGAGGRTMHVAHKHIEQNWDALSDGDVVCVEHILGERETPKISERLS